MPNLSKVAAMLARPKAWVIEQALKEYLSHEKHFIEAVAQSIEEADQGKLIPHSQVMKELHNKIKNYIANASFLDGKCKE